MPAGSPVAGEQSGHRNGFPQGSDRLFVGELAVLAGCLLVALIGLAGLVPAHMHRYSLGAVAAGTVLGVFLLAVAAWLGGRPPKIALDVRGLLVLTAVGLFSLFMFLPGYHYGAGDRDPGGYMMVGAAIARTGSVGFTDPVLASDLPVVTHGNARFPGIWVSDPVAGTITPQFYHLWSALLATAHKLDGFGGEANATPLVGVLAVLLLVCVARRIGGLLVGAGAGLLMSAHMMQVWQAKYPSAEMFTQMLYLGAVLGLVLAFQTRWRWPALAAGALVGVGWLARADGLLVVLIAVGVGAVLYVLRRFDARGWWFAAGLAPTSAYAAYQAYGPAALYTHSLGVPHLPKVCGVVALCVVGALLLRPVADRLAARWAGRRTDQISVNRTWQVRIGAGVVGLYAVLFVLALVRPAFGYNYEPYHGRQIRSYDERSLYWLSWFFTWPGLLLMLVGIGAVALGRWTPAPWVIAVPTLLLVPVYAWHALNSPFLMWWSRRYVSYALPGMILLIVLGLVAIWQVGRWLAERSPTRLAQPARLAGAVCAIGLGAFLLVVYLGQSLPLRSHDEWGGSYAVSRDISALGNGKQGVFLWQPEQYCCAAPPSMFGGPLWLEHDQISVYLPSDKAQIAGYVRAYVQHFRDQPVFLVYVGTVPPPPVPGLTVTTLQRFRGSLPRWSESSTSRPAKPTRIKYDFTVYRVTGTT